MPFDYHLFVSVTNDADKVLCGDVFSNLPHLSQLTIQVVPNRGRDIAPMICFFGNELKSFDFIGHIHSKKSLYNKGATDGWRQYLLDSLLGDSDRIRKIFSLLKQQAGMVYPQNFHLLPYLGYTWLANKSKGRAWCQRLGLSAFPEGYFDFPAGSMFFARSEVLHPLFEGNIQLEDFEPEGGQTDGTLAHTLERILGILVQSTGKPIAILRDDENSSWSRWRFDQFLSHSADSALALLQNPDIKLIVFDIFDTLLLRPLPDAELTKRIVAENAGGDLGKRYLRWRAAAEQEARAKTRKDVNLFQIMAEMRHLSGMSEEEERKLLNLELAIEYEIVSPREDLVWLFNQALLTGKKVVLASDMYLPKTHIENMLERCGIRGWHALYLSSDVNARKDTGKLYDHIIQVEQVHVSQIIAIGDNERSDVQIPCDMGTKSLHVLRPVELARAMPKLSSMVNYKLPQESLDYQISLGLFLRKNFAAVFYNGHFDYTSIVPSPSLESLGYSIVGPTLVSFVQWLLTTARKNRINHLFFLSREGEVMFEVYKKLKGVNPDIVDASYLVLSRRSVNIPAVSSLQDVFQIAQTSYGQDTLESFLFTRFGLTLTDEALEKYYAEGLWIKDQPVMVHDDDINALRPLLTALFPTIFEQGQKEKIALLAYLDSIGLTANDNCAIVDIGFPGTIQHRLNALLGGKIHGYYMLANQQAKIMAGSLDVQAEGCFYDGFDTNSKIPFLASQGFFAEKLLSSDSPQLLYYKLDTDHRIIPHYRSLTQEELATIPLRAEIRKGIMDYVEDVLWIKSAILKDFTVPSSFATRLFEDMFQQLSNTEYNIQKMIILDD
jgi:predicted HAD superfamily hydrolase